MTLPILPTQGTPPALALVRQFVTSDMSVLDRTLQHDGHALDAGALRRWSSCVQHGMALLLLASEPAPLHGTVAVTDRLSLALGLIRELLAQRLDPRDQSRLPALAPPPQPCVLPAPLGHLVIQTSLLLVLAAIQTGATAVAVTLDSDPLAAASNYPQGVRWGVVADAPGLFAPVLHEECAAVIALLAACQATMTPSHERFAPARPGTAPLTHTWRVVLSTASTPQATDNAEKV